MVFPLGIHHHQSPPIWCYAKSPLLCLLCNLWCLSCTRTRRWKRRGVVLPVSARWSQPRVASSWPRGHCPAMPSGQAPGRTVSAFFISSTPLFSGHGLWPPGHDQWAKLTGKTLWCCFPMIVCDVIRFNQWWHAWLVIFLLCFYLWQWVSLTEMLYWILPCCKVQLTSIACFGKLFILWCYADKITWVNYWIPKFSMFLCLFRWWMYTVLASVTSLPRVNKWEWVLLWC
jgi:hypothetical protein